MRRTATELQKTNIDEIELTRLWPFERPTFSVRLPNHLRFDRKLCVRLVYLED